MNPMSAMDATTATFEREVLEASKTVPVVVDFWAPWCGPCRTLGPIIEKVALEFAGRVKLVKVNSDENPELSAAFGVRSIPNVIAFKDGRPAAQFVGALPETQVRAFVEKLLPSAAEQVLRHAEALFAANEIDEAERVLSTVRSDATIDARVEALKRGIEYARAGASGPDEQELRVKVDADPADHETRLALASLYASQRRYAEAMDELLEIVRRAKNWRDGEARKQLLAIFGLAAAEPDLVAEYRRKLASALY
jgi:putative thioredoxin